MELESEMWPNLVKKETLKWLDLKSVPLLSCYQCNAITSRKTACFCHRIVIVSAATLVFMMNKIWATFITGLCVAAWISKRVNSVKEIPWKEIPQSCRVSWTSTNRKALKTPPPLVSHASHTWWWWQQAGHSESAFLISMLLLFVLQARGSQQQNKSFCFTDSS